MSDAIWCIIRCTSGKEAIAEALLDRMGYPGGWHPVEKVRMSEAVYQRRLRAAKMLPGWAQIKTPKRYTIRPVVTGYVFLPAPSMQVHQINGNHPSVWMGVLCVNGAPYRLTDTTMAKMRQTPERIKQLVDDARKAEQEAWEAKRPQVGGKAIVTAGMFEGNEGTVISVGDDVELDVGAFLGYVKVPQSHVERV